MSLWFFLSSSSDKQETELSLTNRATRLEVSQGQQTIVPFHMLRMDSYYCVIVTYSVRRTDLKNFDFNNVTTLKTGLRVLQGHWKCHNSIERVWLPIDVPYQPWAYLVPFTRNTAISVENRKIFQPHCILRPRWRGSPWNWVSTHGIKKLESWGYLAEKKCLTMFFSRVDTMHQRYRQTDKRTLGNSKDRADTQRRAVKIKDRMIECTRFCPRTRTKHPMNTVSLVCETSASVEDNYLMTFSDLATCNKRDSNMRGISF